MPMVKKSYSFDELQASEWIALWKLYEYETKAKNTIYVTHKWRNLDLFDIYCNNSVNVLITNFVYFVHRKIADGRTFQKEKFKERLGKEERK